MPSRKDISVVKSVVLAVGKDIQENGAGSEKIIAFSRLVNSYLKLVRSNSSPLKAKQCLEGIDPLYQTLLEE